ncbi:DEAD/DEAH box helicase [Gaoshiqia sediminis]|uniref:DEAD/DEAH box helicase n=1 Tax=Gaoshiqia sediminis TaxID=2986998 RepID=A0AA41YAU2_9BACT|nr:DEAD/DEAH box helicase [Gaoshiqia sediminis]MCW0482500.1 DEAD/DEAH box helicase [Gaoshiqia sediminis]
MTSFEELKVNKSILKALKEIGFEEPTPIQEQAIPVIRSGVDVLGIAQTGTGKTAAYLLPIFMKLVKAEGEDPRVLILVPTRELSIQVGEDIEELTQYSNLRHAAIYGGIGWTKHAELIKPGIDILVATPGRLLDLYQAGAVSLKKIKTLVIDEADRMLDMGFMPQIRKLLEIIPVKRQNLLFSATFNEKVEEMSHEFLAFPERIEVAPSATPAQLVKQSYFKVPNFRTKLNLIQHLLQDEETFNRVLIFVRTKEHADSVFKIIKRKTEGEKRILHSNKGQSSRINAINAFKDGDIRIMISTDVSARGLDVSRISHVINFDLPQRYEDYVHRIGRTARANNHGEAITLIDPAEEYHLKKIEQIIRMEIPERKIPEGVEIADTPKPERQDQLREIDRQKRLEDPEFKGAFHEKKRRPSAQKPVNPPKHFSKTKKFRKTGGRR